jgi:myosin heavy subunit
LSTPFILWLIIVAPPGPPDWLVQANKGDSVWVKDETEVWKPGVAARVEKGTLIVKLENGTEKAMDILKDDVVPANKTQADDMCSLAHINEATILQCLQERAKAQDSNPVRDECYTYMANVLLSLNPLNRALTDPPQEAFIGAQDRKAHPYATAETAFKQMCSNIEGSITNQSIVISGESGAGKTESAKIVLRFMVNRVKAGSGSAGLDEKIIGTNPILEAFGNAKTVRNNNSSRFGKYMKLQFSNDKKKTLEGAAIETYLLEKSRVPFQVQTERNYHAFYMTLHNANASALKLTKADDFHYLNQSGCTESEGWDDKEEAADMIRALNTINATDAQQTSLFSLLAGILHLGNVSFTEESTPEGEVAVVEDKSCLENAAACFGVDQENLRKVMCEKETKVMGETIVVQRNAVAAKYARNAFAKEMYGRMFDWVIEQCNISLGEKVHHTTHRRLRNTTTLLVVAYCRGAKTGTPTKTNRNTN